MSCTTRRNMAPSRTAVISPPNLPISPILSSCGGADSQHLSSEANFPQQLSGLQPSSLPSGSLQLSSIQPISSKPGPADCLEPTQINRDRPDLCPYSGLATTSCDMTRFGEPTWQADVVTRWRVQLEESFNKIEERMTRKQEADFENFSKRVTTKQETDFERIMTKQEMDLAMRHEVEFKKRGPDFQKFMEKFTLGHQADFAKITEKLDTDLKKLGRMFAIRYKSDFDKIEQDVAAYKATIEARYELLLNRLDDLHRTQLTPNNTTSSSSALFESEHSSTRSGSLLESNDEARSDAEFNAFVQRMVSAEGMSPWQ